MTMLVGHPIQAGSWDRKALDREAKRRHYDPSIGAEVALSYLECELVAWWGQRRNPTGRAVVRGLLATMQHVAMLAHRKPVMPLRARRRKT